MKIKVLGKYDEKTVTTLVLDTSIWEKCKNPNFIKIGEKQYPVRVITGLPFSAWGRAIVLPKGITLEQDFIEVI